ncbi:beta-1,4-mannooligosaccharide/beta-1,4-mannosyl-N-acetylglucosamine phosphorylase [Thermosipho japonicus]|uniref:Beta-1,4-mannooligosaccharide/beta-1, 4-mannosyl-N-acetylglucosamine phosphorylase n=1 Tax=Thermosipho japonicus TaxID=90323 RepID=A0A841GQP8_9BACT|nr:glycoside hydrolase family 130 protein [Thermosipho japonicus]MBB6062173.1 beta-1,4-mannooligosaccharide/beta-1,4-mannosyl-N-acetylglucosamine phosphorylase [Thermosipho japonicus]
MIPWEDRPKDCNNVIWRYSKNPIIKRNQARNSNSIFNSAVVNFKEGFAGVFRVDDTERNMNLRRGFSKDGINWKIDDSPINFIRENEEIESEYKYDPRVIYIEDRYWITWCNGYHGPTIGVGFTFDFEKFYQIENAFLPYNRNGVLFPRKINGKYAMLSRPSDKGHTSFGDIFYSESPDMIHWGNHRFVMSPGYSPWQSLKIGAGPSPIETNEGWLLFYHGVLLSCNGYVYSFGAALLDLDKPWKVIKKSKKYLLSPQMIYEQIGDVQNVVFPVSALVKDNKVAIYYGAADTVTALCFGYINEIIDWLKYEN